MLKVLRVYSNDAEVKNFSSLLNKAAEEFVSEKEKDLARKGIKMTGASRNELLKKVNENLALHIFIRGQIKNSDIKIEKPVKQETAKKEVVKA